MSFKSGFGSNAKQVIYRLAPNEGEAGLYSLTPRQIKALLANTDYLAWMNRHSTFPEDIDTKDKLEAWVSKLNLALMTPIEVEMDCEAVLSCVLAALDNPDSALYNAMKDKIKNDPSFLEDIRNAMIPFDEGDLEASSVLNELWAQCVQIVEFTHTRILSIFADLEVQFNNVELASFTEALPFVGTAIDEAQIDVALDFVNYAQEIWIEQYTANYTEDPPPDLGTKYILACALFCLCKDDGVISVERVVSAFQSCIIGGGLSLDSVGEVIQTLIGINDNNENIVYVSFTAVWGIARLTSYLGGKRITHAILNSILELAENDANDDWETYCEDCSEEEEICVGATLGWDWTDGNQGWVAGYPPIPDYYGIHHPDGWGVGSGGFNIAIDLYTNHGYVNKARLFTKLDEATSIYIKHTYPNGFSNVATPTAEGDEGDLHWYEFDLFTPYNNGFGFLYYSTNAEQRLVKACAWYQPDP